MTEVVKCGCELIFSNLMGSSESKADVDAVQAGSDREGALGKQGRCGHGDVRHTKARAACGIAFPPSRTSGSPPVMRIFWDAQVRKNPRQAPEFVQERDLSRARGNFPGRRNGNRPLVAAVGDGDPQVGDLASELVGSVHWSGPKKEKTRFAHGTEL